MKHALLIFLTFLTLSASAYTITYVPKDASHPFGYFFVKNNSYQAGQPAIQLLHGIGERGNGSANDLRKPGTWPIFLTLFANADRYGYNVLLAQTANNYEKGEIAYGYQQIITELQPDTNSINLYGHSLGGYGTLAESSKNAGLLKGYNTITISSSGPGTGPNTAVNLAALGRPIWLITTAMDTGGSGTTFKVTDDLYAAIIAAGGIAWETKFTVPSILHNGTVSNMFAGSPWIPINERIATGMNSPRVTWYQWILNNKLNAPIKSPMDAYAVPAPVPVLPVILHDTIKIQVPYPVPYAVHDTLYAAPIHDTLWVEHPVILKTIIKIYSDGSVGTE